MRLRDICALVPHRLTSLAKRFRLDNFEVIGFGLPFRRLTLIRSASAHFEMF